MSRYLHKKNEVPPGGFRYLQPETEFKITAPSWRDLIQRVKAHRAANVLPIGTQLEREVEDWLCGQIPENWCSDVDPDRSPEVPRESWPIWAKAMALLAKPDDAGIGSVVERVIGPFGGEAFKVFYQKSFGRSCGCTERRDSWDLMWPLKK